MAVFIELCTDAFQNTFNQQKGASDRARRAGTNNARRPTRGLEIKDDTFAIIKVVDSAGSEIPLIDSSSPNGMSTSYTNFILQQVTEARMEKNQIIETFGDSYIYFFGESPRFLDVRAVLVDSQDFNWYAEWWANWDENFRGTKSVEKGARTYLFYDDNVVEGYMLMAQATKVSESPLMVQMQFRMFLTNYSNVSFVGDPNFPVRGSVILPPSVTDINQLTSDATAQNATLAANLQSLGFGGGDSLIQALQQGLDPGSISPALQGIASNAAEAYGGTGAQMPPGLSRQIQLRSLIADNTDEYTGSVPTPVDFDTGYDPSQGDDVQEVQDLYAQSGEILQAYGASGFGPDTINQLGIGPKFGSAGIGIGISAGSGSQATFGASASAGASFGVSSLASTGLGAGYGFSGVVGSGVGYGTGFNSVTGGYSANPLSYSSSVVAGQPGSLQDQQSAATYQDVLDQNFYDVNNPTSGTYNNGVQVSGGLTSGVGLGGGIFGGVGPTSSFTTTANSTAAYTPGYGGGASLNVGGAPSAFAMVAVAGTLDPTGFDFSASSFASANF